MTLAQDYLDGCLKLDFEGYFKGTSLDRSSSQGHLSLRSGA
ncbi:hypothetical protein AB4853_41130 [Bradyrhizobium sp. 1050_B9_N1_2]